MKKKYKKERRRRSGEGGAGGGKEEEEIGNPRTRVRAAAARLSDAPACSSATDWHCGGEWRCVCTRAHVRSRVPVARVRARARTHAPTGLATRLVQSP